MREVKIEEYWPLIVKGTEEFGQIAVAENPEFNELSRCVYQVLKESFLLDGEDEHASEYGVTRWEKMLGLSHSADMSLDDRKAAILTYLSVKLPYTWRVLKQMLVGLLGEGNFELTFNNDAQKITIALSLSTTQTQIESVNTLIERVVPQNLEIELEWVGGMPFEYTPLEFLESTGNEYINTGIYLTNEHEAECTYVPLTFGWINAYFGAFNSLTRPAEEEFIFAATYSWNGANGGNPNGYVGLVRSSNLTNTVYGEKYSIVLNSDFFEVNGQRYAVGNTLEFKVEDVACCVFKTRASNHQWGTCGKVRIFVFKLSKSGIAQRFLIPALDPTGCPCMFDTVTRKPFYNEGSGNFLYPTNEAPAVSADLDEKFYAKRTEHGIRRLYHVPQGYTGSKDEYAAEHGFKELVEPPMPAEGYWAPEWRETDTHLILEWVEAEPPMEVTEND